MSVRQNSHFTKSFFTLMIIISVLLVLAGLGFIAMYVWEGVIVRLGDPDQSLLFWYLPILFIGIFSVGGGVAMFVSFLNKLKQ